MKRRLIWVLGLFISFLAFPLFAFADVGMPEIKPFDVIVTDKDGVQLEELYDDKKVVIPYDTKLTITFEYYNPEKKGNYGYTTYEDIYGEIDLSKVSVAGKVNYKDYDKLDYPQKLYAIDDVYLYNGPSILFGKVDGEKKIPAGETVEYQYHDEIWAYVEYEGVGGWIYIYSYVDIYDDIQKNVANISSVDTSIYLFKSVKEIRKDLRKDETVEVNIPADTILNYKYYYVGNHSLDLLIEYEGVEGWLSFVYSNSDEEEMGALNYDCEYGIVIGDLYSYEKRGEINTKKRKLVPIGTEYRVLYDYRVDDGTWKYIEYDNKKEWVYFEDGNYEAYAINLYSIFKYKVTNDVDMYELPNNKAKVVGQLKGNTEVYGAYSYGELQGKTKWIYVKYDGGEGWILESNLEQIGEELGNYCSVFKKTTSNQNDDGEEEKNEEDEDKKDEYKMTPIQMAFIGVGGAIVLALVIIVTIALVNKKKNKTNNV